MKLVYVVTEGQTETNFVKRVLCPYFCTFDKNLIPITVATSSDQRKNKMYSGGMSRFEKAHTTIARCLALTKKQDIFVTTMFDFYRLPKDTPGMSSIEKLNSPYDKVAAIENAMQEYERINRPVYIPYVQLHEFEALLFADLKALAEVRFDVPAQQMQILENCLLKIKNPELINNGEETAPSKRIMECIPHYNKVTDGVSALELVGVEKLRESCTHFSSWIGKIEAL